MNKLQLVFELQKLYDTYGSLNEEVIDELAKLIEKSSAPATSEEAFPVCFTE